jgi:hypothetical protein
LEIALFIIGFIIILYHYDNGYWGIIRLIFKIKPSISSVKEPVIYRDVVGRIIQSCIDAKENLYEKKVFQSYRGGFDPLEIALTDHYVLIGTTRLTYNFKFERSCINEISYERKMKFSHNILIKVREKGEVRFYKIVSYSFTKKAEESSKKFISIIEQGLKNKN